jgi:hypothetical protein
MFDDELGQKTVGSVNSSLGELPRDAKILTTCSARYTLFHVARPTNRQRNEIARRECADLRAHLNDLAQRFVAKNEPFRSSRGHSVVALANLAVGAANTDFADPHHHIALPLPDGRWDIDDLQLTAMGEDCQCSHR